MGVFDPPSPGTRETRAAGAQAFEALFHAHYGFVHRCARRYGLPAAQADDATQEVFLIAHRRFGEFDPAAPRPFLRAVVWRVSANARRRSQVRERRAANTPVDTVRAADTSDAQFEARERAQLVAACLRDMPQERAEAFELVVVEGMAVRDVAAALELSTHAVYRHVRAAKVRLARAIDADRVEGEVVA